MKKIALLFVLLAFLVGGACGTASAASAGIIAIQDSPVNAKLSADKVRQGIIEAGTTRGWQIREISKTELEGTLYQRSHMVKVSIPYTAKTYSILYKDSTNMKYDAKKNTIHSSYTRWVNNLNNDIALKLQVMK